MSRTAAVFFDVDFTLIHPGPRFQGVGYQDSCARYGVAADAARFDAAVAGASAVLGASAESLYDAELYLKYTRRIIELMGGEGAGVDRVAREIYDDWAEHHHFSLYDDVPDALRTLHERGVRLGLISNSHRCLVSFQSHFELEDLIAVTISSSQHGFLKPHPSIFNAAMGLMGVTPEESMMVGDSLLHDVRGAEGAGMRGVLLTRSGVPPPALPPDVCVIHSLRQLPSLTR